MTEIWMWRVALVESGPQRLEVGDVIGFDVEATDGHIGKVDEASNDAGIGVLVVDTGFWIFGKKRLLPAGLVDAVDVEQRSVHVACTKDQVKAAPDLDELWRDRQEYRDDVGRHYDRFHGDPIGPVAGIGNRTPDELAGDPIGPTAGPEQH